MKFPAKTVLLTAATSAIVTVIMQVSPAAAGGKATCPCINTTSINRLYATLGFSPAQDGVAGTKLTCTNDPTIKTLDLSETVTVTVPSVTPGEQVASVASMPNPVSDQPFTFKERNLMVDISASEAYCRVDTVIDGGDVLQEGVRVDNLSPEEAEACMAQLQASKAWAQICTGG